MYCIFCLSIYLYVTPLLLCISSSRFFLQYIAWARFYYMASQAGMYKVIALEAVSGQPRSSEYHACTLTL